MKNAIDVRHVTKKYSVVEKQYYYALRDSIASFLKNPFSSIKGQLSKDEFLALDDVSFSVQEGEILGIIGRNGAGKSTLLKILSRITPPTQGEVTLNGRLGSLLEVGTGFHPELTGRENIYLNGAILGMSRAEVTERFNEIVEFAEVSQFLDTPLKHYSSGMYMRLAFSVASHLQSEILLVDEVLAVGDVEFQKKCLGKMEHIAKEGRTVLFVSHNMGVMQQLCKRSLWLEKGKVRMIGETSEILKQYIGSTEEFNNTPIEQRERAGEASLTAKIVDVQVLNAKHKATTFVQSGEQLTITLKVKAKKTVKTGVWLAMKDEAQHTAVMLSSGHLQNKMFSFEKGVSTVQCVVQPSFLTSGRYSLECGLLYPNREIVDLVPDAMYFTVEHLDPYKSNFDFSQRYAVFHVPHQWKMKK